MFDDAFDDAVLLFNQRRAYRRYLAYWSISPHNRKGNHWRTQAMITGSTLEKMCGMGWVSAGVLEGGAIVGHMQSHADRDLMCCFPLFYARTAL